MVHLALQLYVLAVSWGLLCQSPSFLLMLSVKSPLARSLIVQHRQ